MYQLGLGRLSQARTPRMYAGATWVGPFIPRIVHKTTYPQHSSGIVPSSTVALAEVSEIFLFFWGIFFVKKRLKEALYFKEASAAGQR
jgi:hypothetical protein